MDSGKARDCRWSGSTSPIPTPLTAEAEFLAVYRQGTAGGAATFGRLEGCIWRDDAVYLVSIDGGDIDKGQIWELCPGRAGQEDTLALVYESTDRAVMSFHDTITVSRG